MKNFQSVDISWSRFLETNALHSTHQQTFLQSKLLSHLHGIIAGYLKEEICKVSSQTLRTATAESAVLHAHVT
jgi:hypothetical protein